MCSFTPRSKSGSHTDMKSSTWPLPSAAIKAKTDKALVIARITVSSLSLSPLDRLRNQIPHNTGVKTIMASCMITDSTKIAQPSTLNLMPPRRMPSANTSRPTKVNISFRAAPKGSALQKVMKNAGDIARMMSASLSRDVKMRRRSKA